MRRLVDLLAPLGFIVIVGSRWAAREGHALPGRGAYYLGAGVFLILAHLVLRWDVVAGRVGRRQVRYGTNTVVLSLAVLGILGAVNYLVYRHSKRWDLTKNRRFSLSDQTRKVVKGLAKDVKITYFERTSEASISGRDRLKEYEELSPRVKVDYVDPWKSPGKARAYEVTSVPTLVVEMGDKREHITSDSEEDITNALIKVTRNKKKTICFAEGDGEKDIDDSGNGGFSGARSALTKTQYETKKVLLLREKSVPAECTVLVVAGPTKDILAPEADAIRDYVAKGGKALVMADAELKGPEPNLTGLLASWNLKAGDDVVVDVSGMGQLFGTGPITPIVFDYPYHEITKDMKGVMTAFHTVRSVEAGTASKDGVSAQDLLKTSKASWAESDLTLKEPIRMDEGKDTKGPISVAAVATVTVKGPEPSPSPSPHPADSPGKAASKPEGRVVAFGDSDFASNALLSFQGNQDLFLNTVAWLAQDTDLISIRPKAPEDQRLILTKTQQENVDYLALLVMPGLFILLGVATWWRRRS